MTSLVLLLDIRFCQLSELKYQEISQQSDHHQVKCTSSTNNHVIVSTPYQTLL